MGLVGCPWVIADEPGAWEIEGRQLFMPRLVHRRERSKSAVVYIGTLAPAVGGLVA